MSDSSRKKPVRSTPPGGASKAAQAGAASGRLTGSVLRTTIAALFAIAGIAWMAVYINVAQDGGQLTWMGDLGRWNFLIGFGLIFLALTVAAHPATPLGRGRGVVVGMLGCFLVGLVWIVLYYMVGGEPIPVIRNLDQYNLLVGIGFMAVGFVFATKWE